MYLYRRVLQLHSNIRVERLTAWCFSYTSSRTRLKTRSDSEAERTPCYFSHRICDIYKYSFLKLLKVALLPHVLEPYYLDLIFKKKGKRKIWRTIPSCSSYDEVAKIHFKCIFASSQNYSVQIPKTTWQKNILTFQL